MSSLCTEHFSYTHTVVIQPSVQEAPVEIAMFSLLSYVISLLVWVMSYMKTFKQGIWKILPILNAVHFWVLSHVSMQ